jgi:hypothetical protein
MLNVNGISTLDNQILFRNFLYVKDIGILLMQDVKTYCLEDISRYMTHYNVAIEQRGTAFVFRDGITLTQKDTQVDRPWRDGLTMFCR